MKMVIAEVEYSKKREIGEKRRDCNAMLETLRETTLCLRRLHMTPVHSQNEMFGLVRNERDGSYVIADMNPMRAC